jgi:hypothetical protein
VDEWISTGQAMTILEVTRTTIYNYIKWGILPSRTRPAGMRTRIDVSREVVERFRDGMIVIDRLDGKPMKIMTVHGAKTETKGDGDDIN